VVKTDLLRQFEGDKWNPYRWLLKLSDQNIDIRHISEIAYSDEKPFTCEADILCKYLQETNQAVSVSVNPDGVSCTVSYEIKGEPLISIMIPTKDSVDVLKTCVDSIYRESTYKNFEVVIADNNSEKQETAEYFAGLENEHEKLRVIRVESPFNFSYINNCMAKEARGEYLVMMNNDTEVITPDWLEKMLGFAQRDNVGSVGALLYYSDDTIQHGGVIVGKGGAAAHRWYRCEKDVQDYLYTLKAPNDVACCTAACLMTSRKCWDELNGLNEELTVQYNDVDYGIRLLKAGYFNVFLPGVQLYHYESKSRGIDKDRKSVKRFFEEVDWFKKNYGEYILHDPFYNDQFDKNYDYMLIAGTGSN
jgi:GT2 family glycosyltransferase